MIDKETSVGQVYSYAIFYVMTVFTTVGYGSHSYDQASEYILSTILILIAAFYSVLPYYVSRNFSTLREDPA